MSVFQYREHSFVNGHEVWSYYDHAWGGRKFFVKGKDGEYLSLRRAEAAAREAASPVPSPRSEREAAK